MTPRERFIAALERRPISGRVPHFELVFFLTMEAFGKVHPWHRNYEQWDQMTKSERQRHREDIAEVYVMTARRYEHSAVQVLPHPPWILDGRPIVRRVEEELRIIDAIRNQSGDELFLMLFGDPTYSIPSGNDMIEQAAWFFEHFDEAKDEAARRVETDLQFAEKAARHGGVDGFALCSDYCFNDNPFLSPEMFAELIAPYLADYIAGLRGMGLYAVKHTDGNVMPILDQLVDAKPHAIHSLDPQGGVDIAEVKRRYGDHVCLIGNVNSGLLSTGTDEEVIGSARYCIRHGMPGGGYVFSTSNCAFTGLPLERYELMWNVWRREGVYLG